MEKIYLVRKQDIRDALSTVFNKNGLSLVVDKVWGYLEDTLGEDSPENVVVNKWADEVNAIYSLFMDKFGKDSSKYKLSPTRKQKIIIRLKDCGFEMLSKAIINASNHPFYIGNNDRGWKAELEYLTKSYEIVERLSQIDETSKIVEFSIYD